jgi:cyclopropane fatty-acyl-phospholipid synthase-like methyltransferase
MKDFWNERYAEDGFAYGTQPNAFLHSQIGLLSKGDSVLVVGDGEGRNGVWLAERGMQVLTVDYSEAGVAKANSLAIERGVKINTQLADLNEWDWPIDAFDAVVSVFLHFPSDNRTNLHHHMIEALKPGGLILMEAFNKDQLSYKSGGPPVEDMLYSKDILASDFNALEIELLEELITELDEGQYHSGPGAVVRLLGRKK